MSKTNPKLAQTERARIAEMIGYWSDDKLWVGSDDPRVQSMKALDPGTATALDVQSALEDATALRPTTCSQCERPTWELVTVGAEIDYDSQTADLCRACLVDALAMLDAAYPPTTSPGPYAHPVMLDTEDGGDGYAPPGVVFNLIDPTIPKESRGAWDEIAINPKASK